jgi:hypothetical protein
VVSSFELSETEPLIFLKFTIPIARRKDTIAPLFGVLRSVLTVAAAGFAACLKLTNLLKKGVTIMSIILRLVSVGGAGALARVS